MADRLENLKKGKKTQFKSGDKAAKECGRKGGINSGKSKNETKTLRAMLLRVLNEEKGYEKMVDVALREMENGNPKFWELIRDTVGEKPTEKIQADVNTDVVINVTLSDE